MDRHLLTAAITLLLLEATVLLADLGVVHLPYFSPPPSIISQHRIGQVTLTRQHVRRRSFESAIWEDSQARDALYLNDSLLTLSDSGAKIKLDGDIQLDLHENTLVVLEAPNERKSDQFHLRLSRGDFRTQLNKKPMVVSSGEWSIDAQPGVDLSLRTVDGEHVEVEVHKGEARLSHSLDSATEVVGAGQRLSLSQDKIERHDPLEDDIGWVDRKDQRIYAHEFPVRRVVSWRGHPSSLRMVSPAKKETLIEIAADQQMTELTLQPGTYYLNLEKEGKSSPTLAIEVLNAPKITYLMPLPRERIRIGDRVSFSWICEHLMASYKLEISPTVDFSGPVDRHSVSGKHADVEIKTSGLLQWRVIGVDEDGFEVPADSASPFESLPDLLAPPKLRSPATGPKEDDKSSSLLDWFWRELWPVAEARSASPRKPVIFNWDAVPGADFYMIEISSSPDFKNPEVIARVSTNFYGWSNFEKKIYYYRVAGGTDDGRKGMFSTPEKVDLTRWADKPTPPPVAAKPAEKKNVALAEPTPNPAPATTSVAAAPPPTPVAAPPAAPAFRYLGGESTWSMQYSGVQQRNAQQIQSEFTGISLVHFGLRLEAQFQEQHHLIALINYKSEQWRVQDRKKYPFQEDLTANEASLFIFSHYLTSPISLGLEVAMLPLAVRSDLETMSLQTKAIVGSALHYQREFGLWRHQYRLTVESGDQLLGLSGWAEWMYRLPQYSRVIIGPHADGRRLKGGSKATTSWGTGLSLGISW